MEFTKPVNVANFDALTDALSQGQGRAKARRIEAFEVPKVIEWAEKRLALLPKKLWDGATITYQEAGPGARSYGYPAEATEICLTRRKRNWLLTSVNRVSVYGGESSKLVVVLPDTVGRDDLMERLLNGCGLSLHPDHQGSLSRADLRLLARFDSATYRKMKALVETIDPSPTIHTAFGLERFTDLFDLTENHVRQLVADPKARGSQRVREALMVAAYGAGIPVPAARLADTYLIAFAAVGTSQKAIEEAEYFVGEDVPRELICAAFGLEEGEASLLPFLNNGVFLVGESRSRKVA